MKVFTQTFSGAFLKVLPVCMLLFMAGFTASSQVTISYPVPAQQITRGLDQSLLTIDLGFASNCTGINVSVHFPEGVTYVAGSVTPVSGAGGLTITEAGGTASQPSFAISNALLGNNLRFTLLRTANCGSAASGKDSVYVTGSCGNSSETAPVVNTYNLLAPAVTVTGPAAITNASIGSSYTRTFSVTNGGNGCIDTLLFYVVRPSGSIGSPVITLGATTFPVIRTSGDTSFYQAYGADLPGGDNLLCNGETITFTEGFTLINCAGLTTTYGAGWGHDHLVPCQTATATGIITTSIGIPQVSTVFSLSTPALTCADGFVTATVTLTNTGTGAASHLAGSWGTNFDGGSTAYLDTASVLFTLPNGSFFHPVFTPPNLGGMGVRPNNNSAQACLDNSVVYFNYTFPPDIYLLPGQVLTVTYNLKTCTGTDCSSVMNPGSAASVLYYQDQCGVTPYNTGQIYSNGIGPLMYYTLPPTAEAPAQADAGTCFSVRVNSAIVYGGNALNGYNEIKMTLPAGMTFTSVTDELGTAPAPLAGYPVQTGNEVIIRYPVIPNPSAITDIRLLNFTICLPADGSVCGVQTVQIKETAPVDVSCTNPFFAAACRSFSFEALCPVPPCNTGGGSMVYGTHDRTTFGAPDNNQDYNPDASGTLDLTKINTTHYREGDIMHTKMGSVIANNTIVPYTSWPYAFAEWDFGSAALKWQPEGTATVTIKRGGATLYTFTGVTPGVLTANYIFRADWSSMLPGGFTYVAGDSVVVEADFKLVGEFASGTSTIPQNTALYSINSPYNGATINAQLNQRIFAAQTATPAAADKFGCGDSKYNYYVAGVGHYVSMQGIRVTGCNNVFGMRGINGTSVAFVGGGTIPFFPYEVRPTFVTDSMEFDIPPGYEFVSSNGSAFGISGYPYTIYPGAALVPSVTGNAATGLKVIYNVKALFDNGTLPLKDYIEQNFYFSVKAVCSAPEIAKATTIETGHLYHYPTVAAPYHYRDTIVQDILYYENIYRPTVNLQNNTGVVQGTMPQHYWDVQISNTSLYAAPNVWLATEKGSSQISVDSVVLIPSHTVLTPNAYGAGNKWYEVSTTGITATGSQQARIYFKYNSCVEDSIKVYTGFDCNNYPSPDPSSPAICNKQFTWLKVTPQLSQVQLSIESQPSVATNLCTQDSVTAIVNSALGANVNDPKVTIIPPAGMNIVVPIEVEYPVNSGNWQLLTATNSGGNLVLNLEDHTGLGSNGIPGVTNNPGQNGRQVRIKFKYNTTCSFVSGSRVGFITNGNNPCGSGTSIGNGQFVNSNPITINGATTPGSAGMTITATPPELNCTDIATVPFSVTPVTLATQAGDKAIYTLPAGIKYEGNFVPGANCTGCTIAATAGAGGTTILTVSLPAGIAAGTALGFTVDMHAEKTIACGNSVITGEVQRQIAALSCGASTCPSSAAVIGSTSQNITIKKPNLSFTSLSFTQSAGGVINYTATIQNTGTQDAGPGYLVKFYCGTDATGTLAGTATTTATIAAGASLVTTGTFTTAQPLSCPNGTPLFAQIQDTLANGSETCLCSKPTGIVSVTVLPVKLESFTATGKECKAVLSWKTTSEINFSRFEVEYSSNGTTFTNAGTVKESNNINGSTYKFTYVQPDAKGYYRLKMVDLDGRFEYSKVIPVNVDCNERIIAVSPNPTQGLVTVTGLKAGDQLQLYSMDGKLLMKKSITTTQVQLDLTKYASDVFTVSVLKNDGTITTTKIIKIK